jgi:phosphoribosylanthranilate isomerase
MGVKVKICGVTNEEDATWAVNLGADYVGLNFYSQSPRKVSPDMAAKIARKVPPFVPCVGVFVDHPVPEILKVVQKVGLMGVQLHGEYSPEDCRALAAGLDGSVVLLRSFRLGVEADLEPMGGFKEAVPYFLLDAKVEDAPVDPAAPGEAVPAPLGGTGRTFPWALAKSAKAFGPKLFVAGGLTPENVREAVKQTEPFAVDVASGVEKSPKRKDYDKMKRFIDAAKRA